MPSSSGNPWQPNLVLIGTTGCVCRRISEGDETSPAYSEAKGDVLAEISRKAAIKEAKQLATATQEEYIMAEQKARAGEEMVRKIHQREADHAMEVSHPLSVTRSLTHSLQREREERVAEMKTKPPHFVPEDLKKEITRH